ncbi:hypothetical protein E5K00_21440 [Hymenobacter aquaticus]|uniref:Uncharacterized protein n=1 Tax=Hymenobacter aquaticus TaxID=1867101 RepID=A0A4Z0PU71_9BACT|nr:hypothetical protein [Hymenobacter aquaticus]TGE20561.1 hypothetical protein E5K00_21440 [Hymenobacter aquaticus]
MRRTWRTWFALFLLSILLMRPALGQQDTVRQQPYAFPELPALTFIDAGSAKISRPVIPRGLATELVNSIDSMGRVKQGLALALAPWSLLDKSITLQDYQKKPGQYILANAQVSLGTVRVAGDAHATDLGIGARVTLIDKSDPMRDTAFTNSIRRVLVAASPKYPVSAIAAAATAVAKLQQLATDARAVANARPADTEAAAAATKAEADLARGQLQASSLTVAVAQDQAADKAAKEKIAQLRKRWNSQHWNQTSFSVAAATGWRLSESQLAPAAANRQLGWSAWATGAVPLPGNASQLLGQLRYTRQRQVNSAEAKTEIDNQLQYGARLLFGSATVNFFAELSGTSRSNPLPGASKKRSDWGGGLEFRAVEGMWISTGISSKLSDAGKPEAALIFAGLRWQVASSPKFANP